jgi:hypothetical protein
MFRMKAWADSLPKPGAFPDFDREANEETWNVVVVAKGV